MSSQWIVLFMHALSMLLHVIKQVLLLEKISFDLCRENAAKISFLHAKSSSFMCISYRLLSSSILSSRQQVGQQQHDVVELPSCIPFATYGVVPFVTVLPLTGFLHTPK